MPCAPASRQIFAARVTLGMPRVRVFRSVATLLTLTLSFIMTAESERYEKRKLSGANIKQRGDPGRNRPVVHLRLYRKIDQCTMRSVRLSITPLASSR
jgi:hypothetical protein